MAGAGAGWRSETGARAASAEGRCGHVATEWARVPPKGGTPSRSGSRAGSKGPRGVCRGRGLRNLHASRRPRCGAPALAGAWAFVLRGAPMWTRRDRVGVGSAQRRNSEPLAARGPRLRAIGAPSSGVTSLPEYAGHDAGRRPQPLGFEPRADAARSPAFRRAVLGVSDGAARRAAARGADPWRRRRRGSLPARGPRYVPSPARRCAREAPLPWPARSGSE